MEKTASELVKPVFSASGAQIIPFTKVTMGYLSGGGEYGEVKAVKEDESFPFAGGAGTVVNIKPAGFLIDDGTTCRVVKVSDDPIDSLVEKAGDLLDKVIGRDET